MGSEPILMNFFLNQLIVVFFETVHDESHYKVVKSESLGLSREICLIPQ